MRTSFFRKRGKKGSLELSLTELIGGLLAVIVIGAIVYVGLLLSGILISSDEYDSALSSFEVISNRVEGLIADKNFASKSFLYSFKKDSYMLIGFSYADNGVMANCKGQSLEKIRAEVKGVCPGACLCLFAGKSKDDFGRDKTLITDVKPALKCRPFEGKVVFVGPNLEQVCSTVSTWSPTLAGLYPTDSSRLILDGSGNTEILTSYKYLLLDGMGTSEIYMDKVQEKDGTTIVFITPFTKDNTGLENRKRYMEQNYKSS
jgi:hypothetical protein